VQHPEWSVGVEEPAELKSIIYNELSKVQNKPTPAQVEALFKQITATREIEFTLNKLSELDSQAVYIPCDITDQQQVKECIKQAESKLGTITGIIHGAGNIADKKIEHKTEKDFDIVYNTKVKGLLNLLRVVDESSLRYLSLFSSVSGYYGNAGQTDYALANEALNKTALSIQCRSPHIHVRSFIWGPWEKGMVNPQLKKLYDQYKIKLIPVEEGNQYFANEFRAENHSPLVIIGSPIQIPKVRIQSPVRIFRIISPRTNPFILDHVVGGKAVLPLANAIAWMVNACEHLLSGYFFHQCVDFNVLKGILFDREDQGILLQIEIKLLETSPEEECITFQATVSSIDQDDKTVYHYRSTIQFGQQPLETRHVPIQSYSSNLLEITGEELYQTYRLFHGPSFQGIQTVIQQSESSITAEVKLPCLPNSVQGNFLGSSLNPFLFDVVMQCCGCVTESYSLPLSIDAVKQFRPLCFDRNYIIQAEKELETEKKLITHATLLELDGTVCMTVTRCKSIIMPDMHDKYKQNRLASLLSSNQTVE
jgi:NAD(P)-dependent dehydrogenase (short-subunit alcohol dehydrogenase family)